jgi:hypothetical protein
LNRIEDAWGRRWLFRTLDSEVKFVIPISDEFELLSDDADIILCNPVQGEFVGTSQDEGMILCFHQIDGTDPKRKALL